MQKNKFKIGDKVRFVGHPDWHNKIKKDIGLTAIVKEINLSMRCSYGHPINTKVEIIGVSRSGNKTWVIIDNEGIELINKQLVFDFMHED